MGKVFLTILRMGLVSGYAVLVVLIARGFLRRFPKRYSYLLWSVVFLRLVCPVGIKSPFSLVPDVLFAEAGNTAGTSENADGGGQDEAEAGTVGGTGTGADSGKGTGTVNRTETGVVGGTGTEVLGGAGTVAGTGMGADSGKGTGTDNRTGADGGTGTKTGSVSGNPVQEGSLLTSFFSAQRMGIMRNTGDKQPEGYLHTNQYGSPEWNLPEIPTGEPEINVSGLKENEGNPEGNIGKWEENTGNLGENAGEPDGKPAENFSGGEKDPATGTNSDAGTKVQSGQSVPLLVPGMPETQNTPEKPAANGRIPESVLTVFCVLWIAGILVFWLVWARSIRRFRKKLLGAVRVEKNVYETRQVTASFVDGIFRPVIYIAPGLSGAARQYVLCHERVHVARKDPFIKAAALFLVSIYWFHPLIWVAFKKMCEDMEMSCDERVVELLGSEIKKEYSSTLLRMAQEADEVSLLAAFGGNEVKSRVKNVLSYRKPKKWIAILLLAAVMTVGCGLGLNPGGNDAGEAGGRLTGDEADEDRQNGENASTKGQGGADAPDGKNAGEDADAASGKNGDEDTDAPGGKNARDGADAADGKNARDGMDAPDGKDSQGGENTPDSSGSSDEQNAGLTNLSTGEQNVPKTDDYITQYASVLNQYYTALEENWDMQQLTDAEISILSRYCHNGNVLDNVGYTFWDLDRDGQMELLIGAIAGDEFVDRQIFDLYQLKDGAPVHVFSGRERSRYYLCDRGDDSLVMLANEGSSGAADSEWRYSIMQEGEFLPVQIVFYDGGWYAAYGESALSGNLEPVTEEEVAHAITKTYMKLEYRPFADLAIKPEAKGSGGGSRGSGERGESGEAAGAIKWKKAGGKSVENQMELILNQREIWELTDNTLERVRYTVTDVNRNGRLELIAASCQGTGIYTYADIYEVSEDGNSLVRCEHMLKEGESQADIIVDSTPVYYQTITRNCRYIFDDFVKDGAAYSYEGKQYWEIFRIGEILEGTLAYRITEYVDGEPVVTYGSGEFAGVSTTNEEEFISAADREYSEWLKATAKFCWISAPEDSGAERTKQAWRERLREAYDGFSIESDDPATARTQEVFEREFFEEWKKEASDKGYGEQEAKEWYALFQKEGLTVEEGDGISDLCFGDFDGNGITDCFFAVIKKGAADNVCTDGAFWGCMNGEAFYCREFIDNYAIALKIVAGDFNHDGFTELVLGGDTGGCGGGGCVIWQMLQYRDGKLAEMKMPSDENWRGETYTCGYRVSVYETEKTKTCRAVLEQDGREVLFTITGSREYAPYLDEAVPGWRDGKEPFGGDGRGYMYNGAEVIKQDGRDYLLMKECLVPRAVNGEIANACFVIDWDEDGNAYVKDFYVEAY